MHAYSVMLCMHVTFQGRYECRKLCMMRRIYIYIYKLNTLYRITITVLYISICKKQYISQVDYIYNIPIYSYDGKLDTK